MSNILIVFVALLVLEVVLRWIFSVRFHRCRGCRYYNEHYITAFNGQGLHKFGYCEKLIHQTRMVDGDLLRTCRDYEKNKEACDVRS